MRFSYWSFHCQMRSTSSSRPRSWRVFFSSSRRRRLDHGLRGDAGVIGAGHPQGVVALHAPPADQHVLQRVVEGVAHVQGAGHVRRRDDDGERLAARVGPAVEVAVLVPEVRASAAGPRCGSYCLGSSVGMFSPQS